MNPVIENIKKRRSVRRYSDQQIEQEILEQVLEAGIYAPSGHNEQPWHFTVIQNKDLIDRINVGTKELIKDAENPTFSKMGRSKRLHLMYGAPTIIVVSGDLVNSVSMVEDISAATQNMSLAAHSLGLGSCWIGLATVFLNGPEKEELLKTLKIPEGFTPQHVLTLGYPKSDREMPAPKRDYEKITYIK